MRYIGFDLGDGESAVALLEQGSSIEPIVQEIGGNQSVISAVGLQNGRIVVGEQAYAGALSQDLAVRFKSRFTDDPSAAEDVARFARGVLAALKEQDILQSDDHFVVGCPAGWNAACRLRYQSVLERAGLKGLQIISESRAAFLYAKYAKTVALDIDVMRESALVVDIGSSTLDFAYIVDGRETGVGTFGDTHLGGGVLDAALLERAMEKCPHAEKIRQVFAECRSWRSYIELEIRKLKERYYEQETDDPKTVVKKQLRVCYDGVQKLSVTLDAPEMTRLIEQPLDMLNGRSFTEAVQAALENARMVTREQPPRLVLLTGGASRMQFFQALCRESFPNAVVVCCPEPEFSIAKGLAYAGWIDENLRAFRQTIANEVTDERVGQIARARLPELTPSVVTTLTDLILAEAAIPIASLWKTGQIDTLEEMNGQMAARIRRVMGSALAEQALEPVIVKWVGGLSTELQQIIDPICDQYGVPREEMRLAFTQAGGAGGVHIDAGKLMGFDVIGAVAGVVLSVLTALLCGGSGVALIATGPLGMLAGAAIGALLAALGWKQLSGLMMKTRLPRLMRWVDVEKRLNGEKTRHALRDALTKELGKQNSGFSDRVVRGFTQTFQTYLHRIAQAAEIPIQ